LTLIDAFRVQYDKLKTDAVTGSVLEWLDTLAPLVSIRLANAKAGDEQALLQRLLKDIDLTKTDWKKTEKEVFDALKLALSKEAGKVKENAKNQAWLTKRWRELKDEAQTTLDKPSVKRALGKAKVEEVRQLFHRLRSSVANLIGESGASTTKQPGLAAMREELTKLTNAYRMPGGRRKVGLRKALVLETRLNHAAQAHAVHLAQPGSEFSHTGEDGSTPQRRIAVGEGYLGRTTAENIAHGQKTPAEAIKAWIDSPGHEANLVQADVREVGFGYAVSATGDPFWVQTFGEPSP
jgi:uncharacterized protein YkwD